MKSTGAWSSNELQWLDLKIRHQCTSSGDGHQGVNKALRFNIKENLNQMKYNLKLILKKCISKCILENVTYFVQD